MAKGKTLGYSYAVGRRKSASARVRLYANTEEKDGNVVVNGKPLESYFSESEAAIVRGPLSVIDAEAGGHFTVKVVGGGVHSQAEAVRHGIARILVSLRPDLRGVLKANGYLTRDPRVKERKKPGLKRARRAPQWSKR